MNRSFRIFSVCGLAVLLATGVQADEAALERGAELLAPFKKNLKAALIEGMQQGPTEAMSVCQVQAPEIAASLSVDGIKVGRSSHRLRNPANTGPAWSEAVLDLYLADDSNRAPRITRLADDRWGYVEPIVVQPLCVTCHGDALAPEVRSRIDELYPDDAATGFKVGDLRGIFWAEFPAAE